jgi:chemotaxis protein CheD
MEIFLQPGDYFVGDAGYRIRTVLGSCVSITLWHPTKRVGAMSHFLLSRRHHAGLELDGRYGEEAMALVVRKLDSFGVHAQQCHAKIFGGGDMFPQQRSVDVLNVGQKNGESAQGLLRRYGIAVVSESLFGVGHRQVLFDIASGDVWVRHLKPIDTPAAPRKRSP